MFNFFKKKKEKIYVPPAVYWSFKEGHGWTDPLIYQITAVEALDLSLPESCWGLTYWSKDIFYANNGKYIWNKLFFISKKDAEVAKDFVVTLPTTMCLANIPTTI